MNKLLIILIVALKSVTSFAQSAFPDQPTILYDKQHYLGGTLQSNGWGGFFTYGKYQNAFKIKLFHVDLQFIRHEKEFKRFSSDPNARGYVYGKLNSFFVLHAGFGQKKIITEKLRKNGVQLSHNWIAGPSLGFTKPVYLEIFYIAERGPAFIRVERFDPSRHFIDNIYGRAGGLRGFDQIQFHPGGFFRWGLLVEYSNVRDGLKGIEVGGQIDVYARRIPIMAERILEAQEQSAKNHQIFPSVYVNFFFGRKYNKV
jgi:hypothetical protein